MPLKYHFKFTIFLISDVSLSENEIDNNRIANSVLHIGTDFTKASLLSKCHHPGTCANIISFMATVKVWHSLQRFS